MRRSHEQHFGRITGESKQKEVTLGKFGWIVTLLFTAVVIVVVTYLPRVGQANEAEDGRRIIDVWSWNIAAMALDAVSPEFEAEHPELDVRVERNGTLLQSRLLLSLAGRTGAPDISQLQEREAAKFTTTGRLVDLTEMASQYEEDFPAAFWQSVVVDNRVYGVPWDLGPVAVYYKRWIFDKYGLDPTMIETWDDFIAMGRELLERSDGEVKMMPLGLSTMHEPFQILMQQNGGGVFDAQGRIILHSPRNAEALAILGKLLDSGICAPITSAQEIQASFGTDTVATYPGAVWLMQNIKDYTPTERHGEWGIFRLLAQRPGGLRTSNLGGSVLVIPEQGDRDPAAAFAFVEYALCTVPGQIEQFKKFGLFPAYLPAHDHPFFEQPDPFFGGQHVNQLFARDIDQIPPLTRTADWMLAERLLFRSLARYATERPDEATFLRNLAEALARDTGRELAPMPGDGQ